VEIATGLGNSLKTVERELDSFQLAGELQFVGPSKSGAYWLVVGSN
jgi:hypothetical protein